MNYKINGRPNVAEILEKVMLLTLGFVPSEDQTFVIDGALTTDRLALAIHATYSHANKIYSVRWRQTDADDIGQLIDFVQNNPAGIIIFDDMKMDDPKETTFRMVTYAATKAGHKIIRINVED